MNALTTLTSAELTMSSREIAELTEKRHDNVMADIRKMLVELHGEGGVLSFQDTQVNHQNGQSYPVFVLPKRETLILVSGYNLAMRARIIDRWQELEAAQAPTPSTLSRMDILKLAMESEQARILAEEQRDEAIRTKALIGSKREATAMATAAKAARDVKRLTEELGRNARHATVIAVEKATGRRFGPQDWRPLREFCKAKGLSAERVTDPRWGEVKAWPSEAWRAVYGIDLLSIFPAHESRMH